jgi:hypothetical protein
MNCKDSRHFSCIGRLPADVRNDILIKFSAPFVDVVSQVNFDVVTLSYSADGTSPVPEPATLALLGLVTVYWRSAGGVGLGGIRHGRSSHRVQKPCLDTSSSAVNSPCFFARAAFIAAD